MAEIHAAPAVELGAQGIRYCIPSSLHLLLTLLSGSPVLWCVVVAGLCSLPCRQSL